MSTQNPDTPQIPEYIQKLAGFINEHSKETKSGHHATPRDFLAKLLKEGPRNDQTPTMEEVERTYRLESNLVDATKLANGMRGVEEMKTNKALEERHQRVTLVAGHASRNIDDRVRRTGQARNVRTGEVTEFKGDSSTKVTAIKGSRISSFAAVKALIRQTGDAEL